MSVLSYSYKFSRGRIFAPFVNAKIRKFRAHLFSRTFIFAHIPQNLNLDTYFRAKAFSSSFFQNI